VLLLYIEIRDGLNVSVCAIGGHRLRAGGREYVGNVCVGSDTPDSHTCPEGSGNEGWTTDHGCELGQKAGGNYLLQAGCWYLVSYIFQSH